MNIGKFIAALGLLALSACAGGEKSAPQPASIPSSVQVVAPDAAIPEDYAAFSGLWSGKWGGVLDSKLSVYRVQPDGKASVVYAWGDHPDGRFDAGNLTTIGQITDGVLTLEPFGNGALTSFELTTDGMLKGEYDLNGSVSRGSFTRS